MSAVVQPRPEAPAAGVGEDRHDELLTAYLPALGRGRPTERSLDYILAAVVTGVLFVFGPILGLLAGVTIWGDAEDVPVPLVFLGYIPSIALAVWLRGNWRRRRWR